jgi:ribosomal-protein-alanine N-acetyltransferase
MLEVQIRWMIRRDMPEVLEIERQSFEFSWTEEDFLCCLRQRNCIGTREQAVSATTY